MIWTEARHAELLAMRADRISISAIAKAWGTTRSTIAGRFRYLAEKGADLPAWPAKSTETAVIAYHEANPTASAKEIADGTGIRYDYVRKVVSLRNLPVARMRDRSSRVRSAAYLKDHPEATAAEVAAAVNISVKALYKFELPFRHLKLGRQKSNVVKFPNRAVPPPRHEAPEPAQPPSPSAPAPKLRVIVNTDRLIADFIERNGVRRFEDGDGADYYQIAAYLRDRGYSLVCAAGQYRFNTPRRNFGKGDRGWRAVIEFVDRLRLKEGLPPILRESAA